MSTPPFPERIEGVIFTEIIQPFLSEVGPKKLVELGAIVREKKRTQLYETLTDSLRKIQWVKLVGLKAIAIEKEIIAAMEPNTLVMDPLGQTAHALCVTDCLVHTKSALDSMAVFLTDMLGLEAKGGDRDFKKLKFRQLLAKKDLFLRLVVKKLEPWFTQLQKIRDEWIHRSSIRCFLIHGESKVGALPIPRKVTSSLQEQDRLEINEENFWSTKDFVEYHYSNLLTLFLNIIDRCLQIERLDLTGPTPIPAEAEKNMTMFPTKLTQKMMVEKMRVKIPKSMVDW